MAFSNENKVFDPSKAILIDDIPSTFNVFTFNSSKHGFDSTHLARIIYNRRAKYHHLQWPRASIHPLLVVGPFGLFKKASLAFFLDPTSFDFFIAHQNLNACEA